MTHNLNFMFFLSDYDFKLHEDLISQTPAARRDMSRLICLGRKNGNLSHHTFQDIYDILTPSDLLVVNNTEVIPGRLLGRKDTGGRVEILILDYAEGCRKMGQPGVFECKCLIKASKCPKKGSILLFDHGLTASVTGCSHSIYTVRFCFEGDFESVLYRTGNVPLPPYIKRDGNQGSSWDDRTSYQTVYASEKGAIAAPTAGLHFSEKLLEKLKKKGVTIVPITLHVGYGTFMPVRVDDIREHDIHSEWYHIPNETADLINTFKERGGRIVAVGTTSVRTLEYASDRSGKLTGGTGNCDLFIYPGYRFKIVDAMITNFHLPKSTLIMLVSAFAGRENVLNAYKEAIQKKYRFYSYGDAMFIG